MNHPYPIAKEDLIRMEEEVGFMFDRISKNEHLVVNEELRKLTIEALDQLMFTTRTILDLIEGINVHEDSVHQ